MCIRDSDIDIDIDIDSWLRQQAMDSSSIGGSKKPHILFVLADDLGWNSIGNNDFDIGFAAPFLSDMASNGIIMENYYAQEMCCPSRVALMTGRSPLTVGMQYHMIKEDIPIGLPLNETLFVDVLKNNGYTTYMFGKWDLGHYSPQFLPTARGFDYFVGYLSSSAYYWSKKSVFFPKYQDLLASDTDCYQPYLWDDKHEYSTWMYKDKAIKAIEAHNMADPMFMYLPFTAVHNPFGDLENHIDGLDMDDVGYDFWWQVQDENVIGGNRKQYAMALYLMDSAVSDIYDALDKKGMAEYTFVIFASDNGGCFSSGGKNGPLRGTKGSLFEGGVKVDSFIYNSNLPKQVQGTTYSGLMHVSDWFPTILSLTNIDYTPGQDNQLDGINQLYAMFGEEDPPREYLLYNYYTMIPGYFFDMWINGSLAIRNSQYKLLHTFNSSTYSNWYEPEMIVGVDDDINSGSCSEFSETLSGIFQYYLFDLENDPYETTNLYYSTNREIEKAKTDLYTELEVYYQKGRSNIDYLPSSKEAEAVWKINNDVVTPWANLDDIANSYWKVYPVLCDVSPKPFFNPAYQPTEAPTISPYPSTRPTNTPTYVPGR